MSNFILLNLFDLCMDGSNSLFRNPIDSTIYMKQENQCTIDREKVSYCFMKHVSVLYRGLREGHPVGRVSSSPGTVTPPSQRILRWLTEVSEA